MSNLNTLHLRWYVDRWKKLNDKLGRKLGFPLNLGVCPLKTMKLPQMMVRFMKGAHHDIRKTFSNFYEGMVRPYHGTKPGILFSNHVFHFLYSC